MTTIQERINELMNETDKQGLSICRNGNDTQYMKDYPDTCRAFNINRIERALNEIPQMITKSATYRKSASTSYGLKHRLSDFCKEKLYKETNSKEDPYISNGDFIVALMLLNYEIKFPKCDNGKRFINCNIKYKLL
jgi:hypothetical protein